MSDFTNEQLEALKEGAKNAPWRPEYDEGEEHWLIAFDHPKFGGRWDKGVAHGEGAAKLFAAAPDLVDALIAEKRAHQRLRAEIEALRDLPEPAYEGSTTWYVPGENEWATDTYKGKVMLEVDIEEADNFGTSTVTKTWFMPRDEARALAMAILAAVNHAEREQGNE